MSKPEKRENPERQQPALAARLRVTLLRTSRNLRSEQVGDLTEGQHSVVGQLVVNGSMSLGELAEREHVRPPSMTRIINALEKSGYVERTASPNDRRRVKVQATAKAHEHVKETRRRRDQWLAKRLGQLTVEERATLSQAEAILRRMYQL